MRGTRHSLVLFTFIALSIVLIGSGYLSSWKPSYQVEGKPSKSEDIYSSESYFSKAIYYVVENNGPVMHLDSQELSLNGLSDNVFFTSPKGVFFSSTGEPVHYESLSGLWMKKSNQLILKDKAYLRHNDTIITSKKMTYNTLKEEILAEENVVSKSKRSEFLEEIVVHSDKLFGRPKKNWSRFSGNVHGNVKRMRAYEESVEFWAQQVDVDFVTGKADLLRDVRLKKQRVTAKSLRGEMFLENYNKKLKYFALYDDVVVNEKVIIGENSQGALGEHFERIAYADKLEGFMKDRTLVLTGYPKVIQKDDVIKGNVITLREDSEIIEVDDANSNFKLR